MGGRKSPWVPSEKVLGAREWNLATGGREQALTRSRKQVFGTRVHPRSHRGLAYQGSAGCPRCSQRGEALTVAGTASRCPRARAARVAPPPPPRSCHSEQGTAVNHRSVSCRKQPRKAQCAPFGFPTEGRKKVLDSPPSPPTWSLHTRRGLRSIGPSDGADGQGGFLILPRLGTAQAAAQGGEGGGLTCGWCVEGWPFPWEGDPFWGHGFPWGGDGCGSIIEGEGGAVASSDHRQCVRCGGESDPCRWPDPAMQERAPCSVSRSIRPFPT